MLKDKIISTFQKYPYLKILFFFDPEGESKEEVIQMQPEDFRIVLYNNDAFNLKIQFRNVWNDEKVFLYFPNPRPEKHEEYLDFPLLYLLVANKELRLDDVGEFMEEFQLKPHQRFLIQKYIRELKNDNVQKVAAPVLKSSQFEEKPLQRALISSFLKFSKIESPEILLSKMIILAAEQDETELRRFQKKNV